MVNLTQEHCFWSRSEFSLVVELTINHKFFLGFGEFCDIDDDIVIAFEMPINAINDKLIHTEFLPRPVLGSLALKL